MELLSFACVTQALIKKGGAGYYIFKCLLILYGHFGNHFDFKTVILMSVLTVVYIVKFI